MRGITIKIFCSCVLFCTAGSAQDNNRVQPKLKTVYLPTKKINQALQNAFVIDSLMRLADSLETANTNLLATVSEKENLLNSLIILADSEATVIKNAQLQISALESKSNKATSTSNLLLVTAILSSFAAIVFLILLLVRKKATVQVDIPRMPAVEKKQPKIVSGKTEEPVSVVPDAVVDNALDLSRKRDASHTVVQLERLAKMLEMGILTQEEFTSQKQDILKGS